MGADVTFSNRPEAEAVVKKLHNAHADGRILSAEIKKSTTIVASTVGNRH